MTGRRIFGREDLSGHLLCDLFVELILEDIAADSNAESLPKDLIKVNIAMEVPTYFLTRFILGVAFHAYLWHLHRA